MGQTREHNCKLLPCERRITKIGGVESVECSIHWLPQRSDDYFATTNDDCALQ